MPNPMEQNDLKAFLIKEAPFSKDRVLSISSVTGGCIHNAWEINMASGKKFFAKTCGERNLGMLEFEASGLLALNKKINDDFLIVPRPLTLNKVNDTAILLIPWLEMGDGNQRKLGAGLAMLHKQSKEEKGHKFGWESNGFIGSNPQLGGWRSSWGECFVQLRLIPQIKIAQQEWGLDFQEDSFSDRLEKYLDKHNPQPSIVHGDLWKGNTAIHVSNGKGIIFDPAIWWADREVDIAMTKLFGGFTSEFYNSYEKIWKLPKTYRERTEIYNLYHILNHANLFGGIYKEQSRSSLERVRKLI